MSDLAYLTVADGAQLLRAKKLSPVEWTRALLDRIAAVDHHTNAFLTVTADRALTVDHLSPAREPSGVAPLRRGRLAHARAVD